MVTAVLLFAAITALFEAIMLLKWFNVDTLHKPWVAGLVHIAAFGINLLVHWGTLTGTMTAITAALVSFAVYPAVIWLKTFRTELKNEKLQRTSPQRNRAGHSRRHLFN